MALTEELEALREGPVKESSAARMIRYLRAFDGLEVERRHEGGGVYSYRMVGEL